MFLNKYLDSFYLDLVYDNYDIRYLNSIDEDNFDNVYNLLKKHGFYFINDIILNYMELFELNPNDIEDALIEVKNKLGSDYVKKIGQNMLLINDIIDIVCKDELEGDLVEGD